MHFRCCYETLWWGSLGGRFSVGGDFNWRAASSQVTWTYLVLDRVHVEFELEFLSRCLTSGLLSRSLV